MRKPSKPTKVDCASFFPGKGARLECGGIFALFSEPPDGSMHGWCMFCGTQYSVSPEGAADYRKRMAEVEKKQSPAQDTKE